MELHLTRLSRQTFQAEIPQFLQGRPLRRGCLIYLPYAGADKKAGEKNRERTAKGIHGHIICLSDHKPGTGEDNIGGRAGEHIHI